MPVLERFKLNRNEALKERKVVDMFGYIIRVIIQKLVFKALLVM
jgi:hypothetical protein